MENKWAEYKHMLSNFKILKDHFLFFLFVYLLQEQHTGFSAQCEGLQMWALIQLDGDSGDIIKHELCI